MADTRLPTGLWIEAKLRELDREAVSYYIAHKGAYFSGTILLKLNGLSGICRILSQERDEKGNLKWIYPLIKNDLIESEADAYIKKALSRDPDIWAIEIETKEFKNPFEE